MYIKGLLMIYLLTFTPNSRFISSPTNTMSIFTWIIVTITLVFYQKKIFIYKWKEYKKYYGKFETIISPQIHECYGHTYGSSRNSEKVDDFILIKLCSNYQKWY